MYRCDFCDDFNGSSTGFVNVETGEFIELNNSYTDHWLPDGESFLTYSFEIVDLESNILETIVIQYDDTDRGKLLSLSPNGNYLIVSTRVHQYDDVYDLAVYLYNLENQNLQELLDYSINEIEWSNDSNWILLHDYSNKSSERNSNVFGININTLCVTEKLEFPENLEKTAVIKSYRPDFAWSPDGKTFAISGELEGVGRGIFMIDTNSDLIQDWLSSGTCGEE